MSFSRHSFFRDIILFHIGFYYPFEFLWSHTDLVCALGCSKRLVLYSLMSAIICFHSTSLLSSSSQNFARSKEFVNFLNQSGTDGNGVVSPRIKINSPSMILETYSPYSFILVSFAVRPSSFSVFFTRSGS